MIRLNLLPILLIFCSIDVYAQQLADIATVEEQGRWVTMQADVLSTPKAYLASYQQELGLSASDELMLLEEQIDKLGHHHHKFDQQTNGVRVEGAQYIVHQYEGLIKSSNGRVVSEIFASSEATITAQEAVDAAILYTDAKQYYWEDPHHEALIKRIDKDPTATFYPQAELVYADRNYGMDGSKYRLAWKMEVHAFGPKGEKILFIDARDGHILFELDGCQHTSVEGQAETRYHGLQTFMTDSVAPGVYRLQDNSRGVSIETYNMRSLPFDSVPSAAVDFFDDNNYWDHHNAELDDAATDVHWGLQQSYDYYASIGRNSYDDEGAPVIAYVHVRDNWANANWTGRYMQIGDANESPFAAINIVAHELTHGVTRTSANLVYLNESGALNESFSDIFGAVVWKYAAPDSFSWGHGTPGIFWRNLSNPKQFGDPDTYLGNFWITGPEDNGGVHSNSGVQNFWFYLLTEGGTGNNDNGDSYLVQGLGMDTAAAIAYRNLTTYLTVTSSLADARQGAINSAEDLYGPCSNAVLQTAHAWYAVGVGPDMTVNDLELLDALAPGISSCTFTSNEDVTIRMMYRRSGCQNTIPAGTKLPVSYTINNNATILDTMTLAQELNEGELLNYTFTSPVDLSVPAYYDIDFTATFPGDENPDNDVINKFTVVSVETLTGDKLIHFNEFVRPAVPPYYLIKNEHSDLMVAREASATGLRGLLMTGKNIDQGGIDYPSNEEEVFTLNPEYESRICMCVDATGFDSVTVEFDLRQGFSDVYAFFAPEVENPHLGIALQLFADEMPVSMQFHPDTVVNDTIDIDTFVHHRVDLDQLAGTSFNLCFQGKHFFSRADDFLDSEGDYSHLDNIELFMKNFVGTRDELLDPALVQIFPNPVNDRLTIQWDVSDLSPELISLRDISGQLVSQLNVTDNTSQSIDVSSFASGIYFVELQTNDGLLVKKILVQ